MAKSTDAMVPDTLRLPLEQKPSNGLVDTNPAHARAHV
jgi:hypothetical protein